jgi:hypothetical protein
VQGYRRGVSTPLKALGQIPEKPLARGEHDFGS